MTDYIKITKATGTWVVRAAGAVIAETRNALLLTEGEMDTVVYFPREDIAMAFVDPSDTTTHCPFKGNASYYSVVAKSGPLTDSVWSYEDPIDDVSQIAGYMAFAHEKVTVEEL